MHVDRTRRRGGIRHLRRRGLRLHRRRRALLERTGDATEHVLGLDVRAAGEESTALDRVLERTHVARPRVGLDRGDGLIGEPAQIVAAGSLREHAAEVPCKEPEIAHALAERRELDVNHVQSVVEVLAEAARLHLGLEVAVRRGDDADVALRRAGLSEGRVLALLEQAEELHLHRERQLADLVEEERPAFGSSDETTTGSLRAREGALRMAEELALDELVRDRAAVDRDEGRVPASARVVQRGDDELLTGSALAGDEHRASRARDAVDRIEHLREPGILADDLPAAGRTKCVKVAPGLMLEGVDVDGLRNR